MDLEKGAYVSEFPVIVLLHKGRVVLSHDNFDAYVKRLGNDAERPDETG